jgi:molybdate transport system substrate-binding protein
MKRKFLLLIVLVIAVTSYFTLQGQQQQTLIVFAAASLTDAFEEIGNSFEAANEGVEVLFNFGGSSALAAQLSDGAPGDVFASANTRQMQVVQQSGRVEGTPRTFARNRLVLIAPADNPAGITSLRDLANPGVKLVVAAPEVPVRAYTDQMLSRLAFLPTYGETYRSAVLDNVVSEEDNVRQVFLKIALGEADAGIVYQSDITPNAADQVTAIPIPRVVNSFASYPIAAINDSASPELAQTFVDYVLSSEGQDTLERWGFVRVD